MLTFCIEVLHEHSKVYSMSYNVYDANWGGRNFRFCGIVYEVTYTLIMLVAYAL